MEKVLSDDPSKVLVTFTYEPDSMAETVFLAGDFNDWSDGADRMQACPDGTFAITKELDVGWRYRYRFVVDGGEWIADPDADSYEPDGYGAENGVVRTDDVSE